MSLYSILRDIGRRMMPPHYALLHVVTTKWRAAAIEAVTRLEIPEYLKEGPMDITALAIAAHLHQ